MDRRLRDKINAKPPLRVEGSAYSFPQFHPLAWLGFFAVGIWAVLTWVWPETFWPLVWQALEVLRNVQML